MSNEVKHLIEEAAAVLKAWGAREVYVFGSAASGTIREDSDVDIAVSGLPPDVFFKAMGKAEDVIGRPLDLIDLDTPSLFTDYLKRKGKLYRVA
jgi:predicted nucleotidyltransferase